MKFSFGAILKYTASLAVAFLLLWYVFKDIPLAEVVEDFKKVKYEWVLLSLFFSLISLYSRAARWNMMLKSIGHNPGPWRGMAALLTGYLANLVIPRMGEVTRCGVLQKTNKIPMAKAFGTVIAERALDLLCLLFLLMLTLLLEFGRLKLFFYEQFFAKFGGSGAFLMDRLHILIPVLLMLCGIIFLIWYQRNKLAKNALILKVFALINAVRDGILSIRNVENKPLYYFHTLNIWANYFLMTWVVVFSIEETSGLGPIAGLTILMVGGLGMSAPVQGGIGAFHILVSAALVLYGISERGGITFATVLHTSQAMLFIFGGFISLIIVSFLKTVPGNESQPETNQK
jgi:uncharacterized protein (TIRG00374 family)